MVVISQEIVCILSEYFTKSLGLPRWSDTGMGVSHDLVWSVRCDTPTMSIHGFSTNEN